MGRCGSCMLSGSSSRLRTRHEGTFSETRSHWCVHGADRYHLDWHCIVIDFDRTYYGEPPSVPSKTSFVLSLSTQFSLYSLLLLIVQTKHCYAHQVIISICHNLSMPGRLLQLHSTCLDVRNYNRHDVSGRTYYGTA